MKENLLLIIMFIVNVMIFIALYIVLDERMYVIFLLWMMSLIVVLPIGCAIDDIRMSKNINNI